MNLQKKWIVSWQKNKNFFTPLSFFVASWRLLKFCAYYLLKKIPTYVWLCLHLILLAINIGIYLYVASHHFLQTKELIQNFESSAANSFAKIIYNSQMFGSVFFAVYVGSKIFKSMSQEGYDLILCSKPFYRQQIVITKILFLFIAVSLYSLLITIETTITFAIYGFHKFSFSLAEFLGFAFLGNLVAGFLFGACGALLSTKFSEKVSVLVTLVWFWGANVVGGSLNWLVTTIRGSSKAAKIEKMKEISQETNNSPFFYNNFSLNWKRRKPNNYSSLLYTKVQENKGQGFSQEELNFFDEINNQNILSTSILRAVDWLNIPKQTTQISPAYSNIDPISITPWTNTSYTELNYFRGYENLTTTGDFSTTYLLKTKTPDPNQKNELLTITDPKTKNDYFLIPSVFVGSDISFLDVELIEKEKEVDSKIEKIEQQKEESKNQNSSSKTFKINLKEIGLILGSEVFHNRMADFIEDNFYSTEEEENLVSLLTSPNVTKEWLIKRLALTIEEWLKKLENRDQEWRNLSIPKWLTAGLYWLYMNFPNYRIAKVIASNDQQLRDFEPKTLEVNLEDKKYIIGNLQENQPKDYFRPNYLFSYTQNYVVFERWSDVVSWWMFATLWILLTLTFSFALMFVLLRRDFK